jgi:CBS domain-containing protein
MVDAPDEAKPDKVLPMAVTVAEIMRPALSTVDRYDHVAAAAYLMKHASASGLTIMDGRTDEPIGIITEADVAHAVADQKDLNVLRISDLMTTRPTVVTRTTSVRDAAEIMTRGRFRHLPVVGEHGGLAGMVDISDVCRALLGSDVSSTDVKRDTATPRS